ncbi:MAG: hypothetical protein NC428_14615, partial [Clostridium sp.]|nr:hypothetical protein [Clostridium sp.]
WVLFPLSIYFSYKNFTLTLSAASCNFFLPPLAITVFTIFLTIKFISHNISTTFPQHKNLDSDINESMIKYILRQVLPKLGFWGQTRKAKDEHICR